ncbi:hypothetical protein TIFTF001_024344 [Ficus carica]|uniref:Uncharacterized protein n=1 Tax=Ficus carica TaxID=3494 RepID=A0AA88DD85_FICCA|nr:hypothetical protein TIFTF001_024344 [Ficus carica]
MASGSDKANAGDLEACTSGNQVNLQDKKPNTNGTTSSSLEKALAKRALLGSRRQHQAGGRRVSSNAPRSLPSRLSKVSLAEDAAD